MTIESVLNVAFEHIKEALSLLEKVKDKKQKKEREDLIAKLRVFMKQNDDLVKQVAAINSEVYTDVGVDYTHTTCTDYTDVEVTKPAEDYTDVEVEVTKKLKPQVPDNINEEDNIYTDTQVDENSTSDGVYTDIAPLGVYDDVAGFLNTHSKYFLPTPNDSSIKKKLPPTPGIDSSFAKLPPVPQLPSLPGANNSGNLRNASFGNEKVRGFINSTTPRIAPLKNVGHNSGSGEILPPPTSVFDPASLPPPPAEFDISAKNEGEENKGIDTSELFQGMWDCKADETNEMAFKRGQIVHIISKEYDKYGWWVAKRRGEVGFVPRDYLMEAYEM